MSRRKSSQEVKIIPNSDTPANNGWKPLPLFGQFPDKILFSWNQKKKILKYRKLLDFESVPEEEYVDIEGNNIPLLKKYIEEKFGKLGWADDVEKTTRTYEKKAKVGEVKKTTRPYKKRKVKLGDIKKPTEPYNNQEVKIA